MAEWCEIFQSIREGMIKISTTFCPSLAVFDGSPVAFGSHEREREREMGGGGGIRGGRWEQVGWLATVNARV